MGGGLMQLVAYGAQDVYLTGNPQITFFKVVYRRHTNFSMEAIQQTLDGTASVGKKVSATISRNGDLVHRLYVEFDDLQGRGGATEANIGALAIRQVDCEIGGQLIDRHYDSWLEVYAELTEFNPTGASVGDAAVGSTLFQKMSLMGGTTLVTTPAKAFVPLQFWFCRNPGLALPLIALQYHEVKINITFGSSPMVTFSSGTARLWADYIYLDTDERRRFAQVSHEYLIEQIQHQSFSSPTNMSLKFNHPIKELIWTREWFREGSNVEGRFEASVSGNWKLKLNGHDRFAERDFKYFTRTQIWQHHTGFGGVTLNKDSIAVYSFALKPEEHQPSGTCNFSRIDNAQLQGTDAGTNIHEVYAVNYNVLRIMSGMGGLAYSN